MTNTLPLPQIVHGINSSSMRSDWLHSGVEIHRWHCELINLLEISLQCRHLVGVIKFATAI